MEMKVQNVNQIREVAHAQRSLIWAIFGVFAYWLALSRLVHPPITIILFVAVLVELLLVYQLAKALKFNVIQHILFLIAVLIPIWWINLICLLTLSYRARKFLKNAGVKVGLMGVKPSDLPEEESD
jgi:hypothetical protein